MGTLPLGYALDLCGLLGATGDRRFERAVVRLHGRVVTQRAVATIADSQLLLGLFAGRSADQEAALVDEVARRFRLR
jgi:hypothetical protein